MEMSPESRQVPAGVTPREVFVLSDLHLGGRYPSRVDNTDPGFRMMNQAAQLATLLDGWATRDVRVDPCEVIINGDFVDFLAEEEPDRPDPNQPWRVFYGDASQAARILEQVMSRDAAVFDALAKLVGRGHVLTILLGNHDLELSLPLVREALAHRLGLPDERCLRFIYDGEAYPIGDTLIEHGNRYDRYNQVRFDDLRELRSLQSRRQAVEWTDWFTPPPGSFLVVEIMNRLKRQYPFIDLLKPEKDAVMPLLLALEPALADLMDHLLWTLLPGHTTYGTRLFRPSLPSHRSTIAAASADRPESLAGALSPLFSYRSEWEAFCSSLFPAIQTRPDWMRPAGTTRQAIAGGAEGSTGLTAWWKKLRQLTERLRASSATGLIYLNPADQEARLPALRTALRILRHDRSFDASHEEPAYLDAARELAQVGGFRHIVFGHTHLAKENISLGKDPSYWNTGTFCDLMRVPEEIIGSDDEAAMSMLRQWIDSLTDPNRRGREWIGHDLTYLSMRVRSDGQTTMHRLVHHSTTWHGSASSR